MSVPTQTPPDASDPHSARGLIPAKTAVRHVLGVDGGGTGTRARLQDLKGCTLGQGAAGPSGLSQGVDQAWRHVLQAITQAFADAGLPPGEPQECAVGLGLAGATRAAARQAFLAQAPAYGLLVLESDATTMLLGAHGRAPGIVVAAGTGSVAAASMPDGHMRLVGGWGFPVGDEGSGAWLGLAAVAHAQAAHDGRCPTGALARAVWAQVGRDKAAMAAWCAAAGQHAYAGLAPLVFEAADAGDDHARALLDRAAQHLAELEQALQPEGEPLPVVVSGSIGQRLLSRWPTARAPHCIEPRGDSADGALILIRAALQGTPIKGLCST